MRSELRAGKRLLAEFTLRQSTAGSCPAYYKNHEVLTYSATGFLATYYKNHEASGVGRPTNVVFVISKANYLSEAECRSSRG